MNPPALSAHPPPDMALDPFFTPQENLISTLVGQIEPLGVLGLLVLWNMYPQPVLTDRLSTILKTKAGRKTILHPLLLCEAHGYATRTGTAPHENWHLTDTGRDLMRQLAASSVGFSDRLPSRLSPTLPATGAAVPLPLPVGAVPIWDIGRENFSPVLSSSSSDLINQSIDQIDQIEEEEQAGENFSRAADDAHLIQLLDERRITGPRRLEIELDVWITYERARRWFGTVDRMEVSGYKFRRSKSMYAAACLLNHDEPPSF